jgi:hypothetical protein
MIEGMARLLYDIMVCVHQEREDIVFATQDSAHLARRPRGQPLTGWQLGVSTFIKVIETQWLEIKWILDPNQHSSSTTR